MIRIPQPAVALNASDVPGTKLRMEFTYTIPSEGAEAYSVDLILSFVAGDARTTKSGRLAALVINCHGIYGDVGKGPDREAGGFGLALGEGIRRGDGWRFGKIKGLVDRIWITACGAAHKGIPNTLFDGDGTALCRNIAHFSQAEVIASPIRQLPPPFLPRNHIDNYEGLVRIFYPDGDEDVFDDRRTKLRRRDWYNSQYR